MSNGVSRRGDRLLDTGLLTFTVAPALVATEITADFEHDCPCALPTTSSRSSA
jgi:hypothetical protein